MIILCPQCGKSFEKAPGALLPFPCAHCGSKVLGPYCDLTLIGGGAMGNVYRARRPDMGNRTVAIKAPKSCNHQFTQRFEREIIASARLEHFNIVRAFDRGEIEGQPYLVMEFVNGKSLSEIVRAEHPLAPARVARIIRDVASGLEHAAGAGMVNRDIKPENILVDNRGAAKILDYGLALLPQLDGTPDQVTRPGVLLGTTGYMAPEQASDPHGVTILADVYSLGCTAYYALTRELPFQGAGSAETLVKHAHDPRPSVRYASNAWARRPDVDDELDLLVQRMMAIDPQERPWPQEIINAVDRILPGLSSRGPANEPAGAEDIEAVCPECGDVYHLRADTAGRLFVCRNEACGARFRVAPRGASPGNADDFTREFLPGQPTEFIGGAANKPSPAAGTVEETRPFLPSDPRGAADFERDLWASQLPGATPQSERTDAMLDGEILDGEAVEGELVGEPVEGEPIAGEPLADHSWLDAEPDDYVDAEPRDGVPAAAPGEAAADEGLPVFLGTAIPGESIPGYPASQEPLNLEEPSEFWRPKLVATTVADPGSPDFAREVLGGESVEGVVDQSALPTVEAYQDDTAVFDIPESSIVGATPGEPVAQTAPRSKKRRSPYLGPVLAIVGSLLIMALAYGAYEVFRPKPKGPEERWAEIQEDFQIGARGVEEDLQKFAGEFPESPHAAEVPFFVDMATARREIWSDTGDWPEGLKQVQAIFMEYRDKPEYELYCSDLWQYLQRLVERFVKLAESNADPESLARARESHQLLTTVAQAMKDDWVPQRLAEITSSIDKAEKSLEITLAKNEIAELLDRAKDPALAPEELDRIFAEVRGLLAQHQDLASDKAILAQADAAYQSEAARVRYEPDVNSDDVRTAAGPSAVERNTTYLVWDEPGQGAATAGENVEFALARGVLYAFNQRGEHLWSRRLGFDSSRLPLRVPASATLPSMAIAVSTLDNSLLALDPATGELLWRYQAGEGRYLAAPPTLVEVKPDDPNALPVLRGLLPTADGEVHVLELVRGKRIGRYVTGFPMTNEGVYDPETGLAFFPADSKRLFALNPAAIDKAAGEVPAAASVLYTEHASGSLRSRPVVVDRYLILTEAAELERTRVRVFLIRKPLGFPKPQTAAIKEIELRGWSWFTPPDTPDRITVVTDEGNLGVFGLNLDNAAEALYLLIQEKNGAAPQLGDVRDAHRTLAIRSEEHLLWFMAGGSLRHVALDLLNQKVKPLWPTDSRPAEITGVPLHEATMDEDLSRIFIATQSDRGEQIQFAAVDADTGLPLWRRQLGLSPVGDPIPLADGVLLLDRTGRAAEFSLSAASSGSAPQDGPTSAPAPLRIAMQHEIFTGAAADELMRISDNAGQMYAAVAVDQGQTVALRKIGVGGDAAWTRVALPADRLQGRPAILDGVLVAPCSDGRLYRVPIQGDAPGQLNEQTFSWAQRLNIGADDQAAVYPLRNGRVLLAHRNELTWLEYKADEAVKRWVPMGKPHYTPANVQAVLPVGTDSLIVTTVDGRVLLVSGAARRSQEWKLPGRITSPPQVLHRRVVLVTEGRNVVSLDPQAPPEMKAPNWSFGTFSGRIAGSPVAAGEQLVVTDEGGQVTGLDPKTGDLLWRVRLGKGAVPAAAATPIAADRLLVPLRDGAVLQCPLPQPAAPTVAGSET